MEPTFLEVDQVLELHAESLERYGGLAGTRDRGGLESAVAQAQAAFAYANANVFQLAATYLYHITKNHPFLDGNKRTGAASAVAFLWANGYDLAPRYNAELEALTLGIADGSVSKDGAAAFFERVF